MPVMISFAIAREEAVALEAEARRKVGPHDTHVGYDEDGDYELVLMLRDVDEIDVGRRRGIGIWNEIVGNALMSPRDPTIIGVSRYSMAEPPEYRFFKDAQDFLEEHRYEMAVVAAHIACEVVARTLAEQLDTARADHLPVRLGAFHWPRWSMSSDPGLQFLFHAATGVRVEDFDQWDAYRKHVKLRNKIVHQGSVATRDQAEASLTAADAFIVHIRRAADPHVPPEFRSEPAI